jgi:histidyl-tRNA synthetase
VDLLAGLAENAGYSEVVLPSVELAGLNTDKAGPEVQGQMYAFADRRGRQLCLRPEGTATLQALARSWKGSRRDVRLWYVARCWRYERPQAGRYREFTQFGVELLCPRADPRDEVTALAEQMVAALTSSYELAPAVSRGLAYYVGDGFEISCRQLGAQKQVVGGGSYPEGAGFAIGVERLILAAAAAAAG